MDLSMFSLSITNGDTWSKGGLFFQTSFSISSSLTREKDKKTSQIKLAFGIDHLLSFSHSSLMAAKILHAGDPLRRNEIQRHKPAFLEVVPKGSRCEMLALSPEMTTMSAIMRARWTIPSIKPKILSYLVTISNRITLQFVNLAIII